MSKNKRVLSRIEKELKRRNKQRYSRSISATNQLFTPNYLTSKPSRRRVFDPNAQYFENGGTNKPCPEGMRYDIVLDDCVPLVYDYKYTEDELKKYRELTPTHKHYFRPKKAAEDWNLPLNNPMLRRMYDINSIPYPEEWNTKDFIGPEQSLDEIKWGNVKDAMKDMQQSYIDRLIEQLEEAGVPEKDWEYYIRNAQFQEDEEYEKQTSPNQIFKDAQDKYQKKLEECGCVEKILVDNKIEEKCVPCESQPMAKAGGMTDDKSMMGYRDDSQYRNEPYIDIKTRTGEIDMSKTGIPLLANGVYLPPYSGVHQFDTNVVREIPLAQRGGQLPKAQFGIPGVIDMQSIPKPEEPSKLSTTDKTLTQKVDEVLGYTGDKLDEVFEDGIDKLAEWGIYPNMERNREYYRKKANRQKRYEEDLYKAFKRRIPKSITCGEGMLFDHKTNKCISEEEYFKKYPRTEKLNKAILEANESFPKDVQWFRDYMNSPMYKQMLQQSLEEDYKQKSAEGKPRVSPVTALKNITAQRNYNLESIPPPKFEDTRPSGLNINNAMAWSNRRTGSIGHKPEPLEKWGHSNIHEISHSTDRSRVMNEDGSSDNSARLIPDSDKAYMTKSAAKKPYRSPWWYKMRKRWIDANQFPEGVDTPTKQYQWYKKEFPNIIKKQQKKLNYIGTHTETRARLMEIRQKAQEAGIYDPFTEKVDKKTYKKLKGLKEDKIDLQLSPMRDLKKVYSDEEIQWMLNNISKNEAPQIEGDGMQMAKAGGSIDMDLTPEEVEEYKKQGYILEDLSGPRAVEEVEEDYHAGMNAMMKARLAYEYMHGNPAATRMVAPTDNPYIFPSGAKGTHFMSSYDNYAIPEIQSVNGVLKMTGPRNKEAIRFDRPEDANYFAAENYKRISPAFKREGGEPGPGVGPEAQRKWLMGYIKSPMYLQRLGKEFPDYSQKELKKERDTRLKNVQNVKVKYPSKPLGKDFGYVSGMYYHKQTKEDDKWRNKGENKWYPFTVDQSKKGTLELEPEYRPNDWNPVSGYDTTPLHEFSHAADDGGYRIPSKTSQLIHNSTKDYLNFPASEQWIDSNLFGYQNSPSELSARLKVLAYEAEKAGIWKPGEEEFIDGMYNEMLRDKDLMNNSNVKDILEAIPGSNFSKQKRAILTKLLNEIAMNDQSSDGLQMAKKGGQLPKYQGPGRSIVKGAETVSETIAPKVKNIIPEVKNVINFLSGASKEFGLLNEAITSSPAILNDINNILQTSNINYKNPAELKLALENITTQYFNINSKTFSFPKTDVSKDRIKSQATFNISDVDARGIIKGNTESRGIIKTPLTFKSFTPEGKIFNLATDKKGNVPTEQAFNILKKEKFGDIKFSRLENIIKSNFDGKIPSKINLNTLRNFTESSIRPFDLNVVDPKKSTIDTSSDFGFEKLNYKNPEESKAVINSEREDEVLLDQIEYLKEQIANFDDLEAQGLFTYSDLRLMEKELDETQALYDMKLEELNIEAPYNMENKTLLFTNKDLKVFASDKHASGTDDVLSHVHYTVRSDSPGTFTVTQFQADAFQGGVKEWREFQNTAIKQSEEEIELYNNLKNAKPVPGTTDVTFYDGQEITLTRAMQEDMLKKWEKNKPRIDEKIKTSKDLLSKEDDYKLYNQTWEPRILQETVDYAARNGQNTFRFPTQETTVKIQGYNDDVAKALTDKNHISKLSEYDQGNYYVTQRYQKSFPKLVEKIYGVKPKMVTDAQGNTWWEFRIPEGVMKGTQKIIAYKKGGSVGQQDLPKHQATGIVKNIFKYGDDVVRGVGKTIGNLSKAARSLRLAPSSYKLFPKLEVSDPGYQYLPNRSYFEAYPITKSQKFKVKQKQEVAHQEGVDFVKNWFYKIDPVKGEDYTQNLRIRPEVKERINFLVDQERFPNNPNQSMMIGKYYPQQGNLDFSVGNPLRSKNNYLINTNISNIKKDSRLTDMEKQGVIDSINEGGFGGLNFYAENSPSVVFANRGEYFYNPRTIMDMGIHETSHTGQKLGYTLRMDGRDLTNSSWLSPLQKETEFTLADGRKFKYPKASDHTALGKKFKDAMVDKNWYSSVGELHAEMMVARKNTYDYLINKGYSPKGAMDVLQNPNEDIIRLIMTQRASFGRKLDDFFKPETTEKTKIDLLKLLPAGGIGIGIGTMNNDSKSKSKKLKEGGEHKVGDKIDEPTMRRLKKQGYTFEKI